jgi:hypothetical protein
MITQGVIAFPEMVSNFTASYGVSKGSAILRQATVCNYFNSAICRLAYPPRSWSRVSVTRNVVLVLIRSRP